MSLLAELRTGIAESLAAREPAGERLCDDAEEVARACRGMAARFHRGGKLIVFGNGGAGADADHVAVEFLHPVVVGKRALPALSLNNHTAAITEVARHAGFDEVFARQVRHLADPGDIALGVSADGGCANVARALDTAAERGLLTVALLGGDGGGPVTRSRTDHLLRAHSADPVIVKEVHVTIYHVLWELVHVFLEHPDALEEEISP